VGMNKLFLLPAIILLFTAEAFSLNQSDFESKVDFSLTLKELNTLIEKDQTNAAPRQKFIILTGTVSNIAIIDETTASYTAQVELTGGEWIDVEEVKSYQVLIRFSGSEFEKYFNKQRGSDAPKEKIDVNSTVLIVAQILSPSTYNGKTIWLLKGFQVRKLE
jgi:predicted membrane metal-binding protein